MRQKISKETLIDMFYNKKMRIVDIAKTLERTPSHISDLFKTHKIQGNNKYNINYFEKWSPNMAYILGFITADGCITSHRQLEISLQAQDSEILEFVKKEICPNINLSFTMKENTTTKRRFKTVRLRISCTKIIKSLEKLGIFPRKTGNEVFIQIPQEYIPDYLRGYFDGDGSIMPNKRKYGLLPRIRLYCKSKLFLEQIQKNYLFHLGDIIWGNGCYYWELTTIKDVLCILNYIYNGNFCLKRKYDKFLEILEYYKIRSQRKLNKEERIRFTDNTSLELKTIDKKGIKNPRYNKTIYQLKNILTNETFSGTQYEFYTKYNFHHQCIHDLLKGKTRLYKKQWILIN